ncbi:MAG: heavy metal-binding domain-containing protein [Acidimicrobiaceae bacterium]|nr:heavy metal-binding domain-containing protein [Acidimicrobiaceae bacterium]
MSDAPSDLPEAAQRRFSQGAFSSGLSVSDFGACLEMGLEPVGLVQGFCAMRWGAVSMNAMGGGFGGGLGSALGGALTPFAGAPGGYVQNYQCPHGMISADHRAWGQNYQQTWIEDTWRTGFNSAYSRMMQEAQALGAHGVVGVVDSENPLSDTGVVEFHLRGTAVRVIDGPPPGETPWSTFLAGQRLAKSFEAGYAPVSIVTSVASVRVWAYCQTEYLMEGTSGMWSNAVGAAEIMQVVDAQSKVRDLARARVRSSLHGDALHGAHLEVSTREFGKGDVEFQSRLSGNRVRRFKDFDPLALPRPTVRLS